MKRKFLSFFAVLCCALAFASCSSEDKDTNNEDNGNTDSGKQEELLTADESKTKLEEIGLDFMEYIKMDDFENIIDVLNAVVDALDSDEIDDKELDRFSDIIDDFADELDDDNINSWEDYISSSNKLYFDYTDFYGVYTFKDNEWSFSDSSSELKFVIYDNENSKSSTASFKSSSATYVLAGDRSTKEIPGEVTASVTSAKGDTFSFTYKISSYDYDAVTFAGSGSIVFNDFEIALSQSIKNESASNTIEITKNGARLLKSETTASDVDIDWGSSSNFDFDMEVGAATSTLNILDALWIRGTCSDVMDIVDFDSDDEDDDDAFAKLLNKTIEITWGYSSVDVQGSVIYDTEDGDLIALLYFDEDESKVALDEYFTEDSFKDLVDTFTDFTDDFEDRLDIESEQYDEVAYSDDNYETGYDDVTFEGYTTYEETK